jgi:hypothetical protein
MGVLQFAKSAKLVSGDTKGGTISCID